MTDKQTIERKQCSRCASLSSLW